MFATKSCVQKRVQVHAGRLVFLIGFFAVFHCRSLRGHPLPLPLGEVAECSEGGEGGNKLILSFKKRFSHLAALVFAGLHSLSPANPAAAEKAACLHLPQAAAYRFFPLSRLRRQLSQRESQGRYTACWHKKWSVLLPIHSISFLQPPIKTWGAFVSCRLEPVVVRWR